MKTTRPQGAAPKRKSTRAAELASLRHGGSVEMHQEYQERVAALKRPRGRPRKNALVPKERQQADTPPPAMPLTETEALINAIVKAARDPNINIEKMDWLLKTSTKLREDQAEQDFNDAMTLCQADLEPVRKDASNPQTHSKYASYPALDRAVRPSYSKHGFGLSFDTDDHPDPMTIRVVCYVTRGRAKRTYSIPMPCDGKGPKGGEVMTRTHATGSAVTYGRRYLLSLIFNIVIADRTDDDGNAAGRRSYIQPEAPVYPDVASPTMDDKPAKNIENEPPANPIGRGQLAALRAVMERAKVPESVVLEKFKIGTLEDLTEAQFITARNKCNATLKARNTPVDSPKEVQNGSPSEQAS
jgi:hypothetical protein